MKILSLVGCLSVLGHSAAFNPILSRSLAAQERPAPPDSTATDSAPQYGHSPIIYPLFAGFLAALAFAPAVFVIPGVPTNPGTEGGPLSSNYTTIYFTAGGFELDQHEAWTHSQNLEIRRGHLYVALRVETFDALDRPSFYTARLGFLVQPKSKLSGGVTLGYRRAIGPDTEDAVEIGLPATIGNQRAAMRFEPIYLVSRKGVAWNYRFQGEIYLLPKPLFTGFTVEGKSLRQAGEYFGAVTLLFGARW
jgi:hypothetical protein